MTGQYRDDRGMTHEQRRALVLLEEGRGEFGVLTSSRTALIDGQAWINYRTAQALADRGFVRIDGEGEEAEVRFA